MNYNPEEVHKIYSAKRVNIVSVKLVKESSMLYKKRRVRSPQDSYQLFHDYLGEVDREHFVVMCLDTENQSINISTVHIILGDDSYVSLKEKGYF